MKMNNLEGLISLYNYINKHTSIGAYLRASSKDE